MFDTDGVDLIELGWGHSECAVLKKKIIYDILIWQIDDFFEIPKAGIDLIIAILTMNHSFAFPSIRRCLSRAKMMILLSGSLKGKKEILLQESQQR